MEVNKAREIFLLNPEMFVRSVEVDMTTLNFSTSLKAT
jgi:hypothetical protein